MIDVPPVTINLPTTIAISRLIIQTKPLLMRARNMTTTTMMMMIWTILTSMVRILTIKMSHQSKLTPTRMPAKAIQQSLLRSHLMTSLKRKVTTDASRTKT